MLTYQVILALILSYLLGSIPTSVWVGKWFFDLDIRTQGSGNAGATNTIRVFGIKAGLPVLLFDVFKAWLAVHLGTWFPNPEYSVNQEVIYRIILGGLAVLGHVYPAFAGFRGGKGVATIVGVVIALYPASFLVILLCFSLVLATTRIVSLSSIIGAIVFPFVAILMFDERRLPLVILAIAIALFVPYTHRANIKRLIGGTEKRFDFGKNRIRKNEGV